MARRKKAAAELAADQMLKGAKVNKSELVRTYLATQPDAGPTQVAEALNKQTGLAFTAAFVSQIKVLQKRKTGRTVAKPERAAASSSQVIEAALALIKA